MSFNFILLLFYHNTHSFSNSWPHGPRVHSHGPSCPRLEAWLRFPPWLILGFWVKACGFREHAHCIVNPGCKRDKLREWSITETHSPLSMFHGQSKLSDPVYPQWGRELDATHDGCRNCRVARKGPDWVTAIHGGSGESEYPVITACIRGALDT